jgi:hypothetical protein
MPLLSFSPAELLALKAIVCAWVDEGFTTPPYAAEVYALFAKLGITQADLTQNYDITPPLPPVEATKVTR